MKKKSKAKDDILFDIGEDKVAIDFGPIKIRGTKGPTALEYKLREHIRLLQAQIQKERNQHISLREVAIRQQERLNAYRQIIKVLLPKLDKIKKVPDGQKDEAIEKIQEWIRDLTKDDNLEG